MQEEIFPLTLSGPVRPGMFPGVPGKLADNLRRIRLEKALTQQQVANGIGLQKPAQISQWEGGHRLPSRGNIDLLARYYGVSTQELDPDGESWDAERPRADRGKPLQKSHNQTDKSSVAPQSPPPEAGVSMDAGGLFNIPDAELFRKLLGIYLTLDTPAERAEFVKYARAFTPGHSAKAKNNRR